MKIMKRYGEGYSDNDETIEIYSREDAVEAIKRINLLKQDVESLSPDILKSSYEFRMKSAKGIKNKYVIGSKITDNLFIVHNIFVLRVCVFLLIGSK